MREEASALQVRVGWLDQCGRDAGLAQDERAGCGRHVKLLQSSRSTSPISSAVGGKRKAANSRRGLDGADDKILEQADQDAVEAACNFTRA